MKQKPAQELICRESQELFPIAVCPVSPAKGDLAIFKGNETTVGDGDSMSVAAQIPEHVFGTAKRPFAVDHPIVPEQSTDKGVKRPRVGKMLQFAIELNGTLGELTIKRFSKLGSKDLLQHLFR